MNPEAPKSWDSTGLIVETELLEVLHGVAPSDTRFLAFKPPPVSPGELPRRCDDDIPKVGQRFLLYRRKLRWGETSKHADSRPGSDALLAWRQRPFTASP